MKAAYKQSFILRKHMSLQFLVTIGMLACQKEKYIYIERERELIKNWAILGTYQPFPQERTNSSRANSLARHEDSTTELRVLVLHSPLSSLPFPLFWAPDHSSNMTESILMSGPGFLHPMYKASHLCPSQLFPLVNSKLKFLLTQEALLNRFNPQTSPPLHPQRIQTVPVN